jgi:hypothetical protein
MRSSQITNLLYQPPAPALVWLIVFHRKNHISDKVLIVIAWLMALGLMFLVFEKFKLMFH